MTKTTEADVDAGWDIPPAPALLAKKKPLAAARVDLHDDLDAGWEDAAPPVKATVAPAKAPVALTRAPAPAPAPKIIAVTVPKAAPKAPKPSKRAPKSDEKRALREAKKEAKKAAQRAIKRVTAQSQTTNRASMKAAEKARARAEAKTTIEKASDKVVTQRANGVVAKAIVSPARIAPESSSIQSKPKPRANAALVIPLFLAAAAVLAWVLKHYLQ